MERWSKAWMKSIDVDKLTPYPVQLANCDRLEKHDAVYIFDEVGCGKTISSGLMALHYLYNRRQRVEEDRRQDRRTVLVITTNPMKTTGQLLNDWQEKLPFQTLGFYPHYQHGLWDVWICNNNCASFDENTEGIRHRFGLVIIDEAHLFLNKTTKRYKNLLEHVRGEKVVFLTATPIQRNAKDDLERYVEIAERITGTPASGGGAELLSRLAIREGGEDLICARFDPDAPVTRYFKDIVTALQKEGYRKNAGVRAAAHIWRYSGAGNDRHTREAKKRSALLEGIEKALRENADSRFIVFVRYKDKDNPQSAVSLGRFFEDNQWLAWPATRGDSRDGKRYYAIVTGDEGDLARFRGEGDSGSFPHVLLLTHQIAEAGVNLPGFNYVVNYHIPDNPAALEQRFGRVDRLTGQRHSRIHACYLVDPDFGLSDVNSRNFYNALALYMKQLLPVLPARNTLITDEFLGTYRKKQEQLEHAKERILAGVRDNGYGTAQLKALLDGRMNEVQPELLEFSKDEEIEEEIAQCRRDFISTPEEKLKRLRDKIRNALGQMKSVDIQTLDLWEKMIRPCAGTEAEDTPHQISDSIFYQGEQGGFGYLSAADCALRIEACPRYQDYLNTSQLPG